MGPPAQESTDASNSHLRKLRKPLMEKKRRARINECLTELKNLVLQAMNKDPARCSKLEKADILEMTVKHLQHVSATVMDKYPKAADYGSRLDNYLDKYHAGYQECANEVLCYIDKASCIPADVSSRLWQHLQSSMASRTTKTFNLVQETCSARAEDSESIEGTGRTETCKNVASQCSPNKTLPVATNHRALPGNQTMWNTDASVSDNVKLRESERPWSRVDPPMGCGRHIPLIPLLLPNGQQVFAPIAQPRSLHCTALVTTAASPNLLMLNDSNNNNNMEVKQCSVKAEPSGTASVQCENQQYHQNWGVAEGDGNIGAQQPNLVCSRGHHQNVWRPW